MVSYYYQSILKKNGELCDFIFKFIVSELFVELEGVLYLCTNIMNSQKIELQASNKWWEMKNMIKFYIIRSDHKRYIINQ